MTVHSLTLYYFQPHTLPALCALAPAAHLMFATPPFPVLHHNQDTRWHWQGYMVKRWDGNCASCSPLFVFLEIEVIIWAHLIWRAPHCDTTSKHLCIQMKWSHLNQAAAFMLQELIGYVSSDILHDVQCGAEYLPLNIPINTELFVCAQVLICCDKTSVIYNHSDRD